MVDMYDNPVESWIMWCSKEDKTWKPEWKPKCVWIPLSSASMMTLNYGLFVMAIMLLTLLKDFVG